MIELKTLPMRVAIGQVNELTDEFLTFATQMGLKDVQMNLYNLPPDIKDSGRLEFSDVLRLASRAADRGLRLIAIENVPIHFYDKIMLGKEGREQQLENMQETVRNFGRAGIPIFGYHFIATGVWRTGPCPTQNEKLPRTVNPRELRVVFVSDADYQIGRASCRGRV